MELLIISFDYIRNSNKKTENEIKSKGANNMQPIYDDINRYLEEGYYQFLNAFYLSSANKWIRIDARGNKPGINAEFHVCKEQLAFPVRRYFDEIDYKEIYSEPLPSTMSVLENSTDAMYMYLHSLPDKI